MSGERKYTGGTKEFYYSKEDEERIRSQDTHSTREFKKALREHYKKKGRKKFKKQKFKIVDIPKEKLDIVNEPKEHKSHPTSTERKKHSNFKRFVKRAYYKTKNFLTKKHYRHSSWKPLLKNLLIFGVLFVLFSIFYTNLDKLNEIKFFILKLGSILFLVLLFFILIYLKKLYKNLRYVVRHQKRWIKYILVVILLLLLWLAYDNRDTLFNPLIDYYEETDFGMFSPFTFAFDDVKDRLSDTTEKISDEASDFFEKDVDLKTNPKNTKLTYFFKGSGGNIDFIVYKGLNNYLKELPRSMSYYFDTPSDKDFIMRELNNKKQEEFLAPLIDKIKEVDSNRNNQARIAISLVQHIPYDYEGLNTGNIDGKYPYEVLYTNAGVCSEKVKLLIYLLRELGFDTAIFRFDVEFHDVAGIKCPEEYSYKQTGYCFVEATVPSIITDSNGEYVGAGKLTSIPKVIHISEGYSLNDISEEYNDAKEWKRIADLPGRMLSNYNYHRWQSLVEKYDIDVFGS